MALSFSSRVYSKLIRSLSSIGIAQRIAINLPLRVGNSRFRVPVVMTVGHGNVAMNDWWALDLFSKVLPSCPGVFLDVGANVGQTLLKVKSCSPDQAWIGFEPNPTCAMYLGKLIAANGFKSCRLIPAGLYTETGVREIECFEEDPADKTASLVHNFRPDHKILRRPWVSVIEFSALTQAGVNDAVGFVKIDVEGGEKEVLESLHLVLERFRPPVMLEVLPVYTENNQERLTRQRAVEKQFRQLNYTLCRIEKDSEDHCSGLRPLQEIGIHDQLTMSDYLAVPSERLAGILKIMGEVRSFGEPSKGVTQLAR